MDDLTKAIAHLEAALEYDSQPTLSEQDVKCVRSHVRVALGTLLNKRGYASSEQIAEVKASVRARTA